MANSIFPKKLRIALIVLSLCIFSLAPITHSQVTCDPSGGILTGCTTVLSAPDVTITAQVAGAASVVPPTVVTDALTTFADTTATLLGEVTDSGDSAVTLEGFNYGTTTSYGLNTTSSGTFGIGAISANVSGLACDTLYHYRAYATNGAGTSTGSDMTFTTAACTTILPVTSPGGGSGGGMATATTVNFSGTAYPGAVVTILRDGVILTTTVANPSGSFLATIAGVEAGSYVFSAYAKDPTGEVSTSSNFPFVIDGKSIVNISGILVAPTLDIDKVLLQSGDNLTMSGYGAPNSDVRITSSQFSSVFLTHTHANGSYSYIASASLFSSGIYTVHSQETVGGQLSPFSRAKIFFVGLTTPPLNGVPTTPTVPGACIPGDLNCDGKVDIIDFSILKYWYGKPNPPAAVDLDGTGLVGLKDFSILAADWTG